MKRTDSRLVEWAVRETEKHYKNDVSLLLEHNTYCLEDDRNVRYVNTIISDTKPYIGLARTFIIDGIGYDFNQVSWKSFETDAEAKGYFITVLAEANILYSKNEADKQRFLYLRAKLYANLANADYMYQRGLEWLNNAMEVYKTMMFVDTFSEVRKAAHFVSDYLAMAVACYNQTYFKDYDQLKELVLMEYLPESFIEQYKQVSTTQSDSELKELAHNLIAVTRSFFAVNKKEVKNNSDYQYLADWYQECSYYFRRIYHFCTQNDSNLAFRGICGIQSDLNDLARDYGISDLDVLASFDSGNLPAFFEKLKLAEKRIVEAITSNNIKIDEYASVDDFLAKNS